MKSTVSFWSYSDYYVSGESTHFKMRYEIWSDIGETYIGEDCKLVRGSFMIFIKWQYASF